MIPFSPVIVNTQSGMNLYSRLVVSLTLSLVLTSCGWRTKSPPSILVIAVEYLGFDSFSCGTEETSTVRDFAGFKAFCDESVRFTHAYTPSTMTQATLASVLTGKYPFEHGVWHNGSQFLSSNYKTVAEVAIQKGYRTSFFSGGPPVWRKSGLSQGFEVFEDNVKPSFAKPYRPVLENFKEFFGWVNREASKAPFFSLVYVPDLQFSDITTTNDLGEIRERTASGQMRELSETLSWMIQNLKKMGRWDSTTVFLIGTNGRPKTPRPSELEPYNLHSESSQVALYIKPARKKRDLGLEWKIDKNVSLVDIGATLFDFLGEPLPPAGEDRLPVVSLMGVLEKPEVSWDQDRILMVESGWPQWRGVGGSRFSLRRGHYFVLYDEKTKVFNTLIDRQEISPLSDKDPLFRSLQKEILTYLHDKGFLPWTPLPRLLVEKLEIGRLFFQGNRLNEGQTNKLVSLAQARNWDRQLWGWKAMLAIQEKNWKWLSVLGRRGSHDLWYYVAQKNLGRRARLSSQGCNGIFLYDTKKFRRPSPQECEDELLVSLLQWIETNKNPEKRQAQDHFMRLFIQTQMDRRIALWNYVNLLNWDVSVEQPFEPLLSELLLSLPQNRKYSRVVEAHLLREN